MLEREEVEVVTGLSVEIEKGKLIKSLSRVCSIVERRNVIPILSNILLEAKEGKLILSSTDMDIVVNDSVDAKVLEQGVITIVAHVFYDIIRKLDDNFPVSLKFIESSAALNIVSGQSSFMLPTLPYGDFPKFNDEGYQHEFSLSAKDFQHMIDRCKFAIAQEETRYNLNGAYLEYEEGGVKLVSTDGHRLCITKKSINGIKEFKGILIPRKTIFEARKIIDECENNIQILFSESRIKILGDGFCMISKLIDAAFPDYNALIPQSNDLKVTINAKKFVAAVDRVATVTNDKFKGIKIVIKDSSMIMSASSDTVGGAKEEVDVISSSDQKIEIGFNSRYILDVMGVLQGVNVVCNFKDPFAPVIITDDSEAGFQYIVMPMRV